MDDERLQRLIGLVGEREILYNTHNRLYKDQRARNSAWQEISHELQGVSAHECREVWTKLRNAYTNALKRRRSSCGQAAKRIPKWKYEDEMAFLRSNPELLQTEATVKEEVYMAEMEEIIDVHENFSGGEDAEGAASNAPDSEITNLPSDDVFIESRPSMNIASANRLKGSSEWPMRSKARDENVRLGSVKNIVDIIKENSQPRPSLFTTPAQNQQHDEIDMFFMGLARTVKRLSPQEQVRVKMEVANSVFHAELRQLGCLQPGSHAQNSHNVVPSSSLIQTDDCSRSSRDTVSPAPAFVHSHGNSGDNTAHYNFL